MERRPVDYLQPYRGFTYTELNAENRGILNNEQQCSICMADFVNYGIVLSGDDRMPALVPLRLPTDPPDER